MTPPVIPKSEFDKNQTIPQIPKSDKVVQIVTSTLPQDTSISDTQSPNRKRTIHAHQVQEIDPKQDEQTIKKAKKLSTKELLDDLNKRQEIHQKIVTLSEQHNIDNIQINPLVRYDVDKLNELNTILKSLTEPLKLSEKDIIFFELRKLNLENAVMSLWIQKFEINYSYMETDYFDLNHPFKREVIDVKISQSEGVLKKTEKLGELLGITPLEIEVESNLDNLQGVLDQLPREFAEQQKKELLSMLLEKEATRQMGLICETYIELALRKPEEDLLENTTLNAFDIDL